MLRVSSLWKQIKKLKNIQTIEIKKQKSKYKRQGKKKTMLFNENIRCYFYFNKWKTIHTHTIHPSKSTTFQIFGTLAFSSTLSSLVDFGIQTILAWTFHLKTIWEHDLPTFAAMSLIKGSLKIVPFAKGE